MNAQSITTKSYDAIYCVTDESGTREVKRTIPWCAQFVINSDREGYEEKLRAIFNKAQKTDVQANVISIRVFTDTVKLETVDFFADGKIKQVEKLPRGKMAGNTEEDE